MHLLYIIKYHVLFFTDKNINKSIVDILLSTNPQQDDQKVSLVYTLLNFFLLFHPLPVL